LDIRIVPSPDSPPDKLGFTWFLKDKTDKSLTIQVNFKNPVYISAQTTSEELAVKFRLRYQKLFKSKKKKTLQNVGQTLTLKCPAQLTQS